MSSTKQRPRGGAEEAERGKIEASAEFARRAKSAPDDDSEEQIPERPSGSKGGQDDGTDDA